MQQRKRGSGTVTSDEQRALLERAGQMFRDASEALASRGIFFEVGPNPGTIRTMPTGIGVEVAADGFLTVAERTTDGEWFEGPIPVGTPGAQHDAVAEALCGAAEAMHRMKHHLPDGAAEQFGKRMAAHIFERTMPDTGGTSKEVEQAARNMTIEIAAEAGELARKRLERIEARGRAVDRFEKVLDAVSGHIAVTVRDLMADPEGPIGFTVRREPASGRLMGEVLIDPRLLRGDRSLTNEQLAERHGEAYVDLGRALGADDPERGADWETVYGALAATAADDGAMTISAHSCAANRRQRDALDAAEAFAEALREQIRTDGFATGQMKRTWPAKWSHETPRVVECEGSAVRIADARIGGLGSPSRVLEVLARDGRQLAGTIMRNSDEIDKLIRARRSGSLIG